MHAPSLTVVAAYYRRTPIWRSYRPCVAYSVRKGWRIDYCDEGSAACICVRVALTTACLEKMSLIKSRINLTNLNRFQRCFAHSISRIFGCKSRVYFLTEPPMHLLYFALSHSGVNDVSLLRHLCLRAWSTKLLISGVPGCVRVLSLKLVIILNICHTPLLISVVI